MSEIFKHASFYYKGKKVATCSGSETTINSGDEDQIGDEGWMGTSDGATTTKFNSDHIVPVKGVGVSIVKDMLAKKYVDVASGILDGAIYKMKMRITTCSFTSQAANGTLTGRFEFRGGDPEIVG